MYLKSRIVLGAARIMSLQYEVSLYLRLHSNCNQANLVAISLCLQPHHNCSFTIVSPILIPNINIVPVVPV